MTKSQMSQDQTTQTKKAKTYVAPASFEDFADRWTPLIRAMALNVGINADDVDDCQQIILSDLWAGRYLAAYDSTRGVAFESYMFGHIRVRCKDFIRVQMKRIEREFPAQDIFEGEDQQHLFSRVDDDVDNVGTRIDNADTGQAIRLVYKQLSEMPHTRTKNMAERFAEMIEQIRCDGEVNYAKIARKHGFSPQAISTQMADLKRTKPMLELKRRLESLRSEA